MPFKSYPTESDYQQAWAAIVGALGAAREAVEQRLLEQEGYTNLLVADRQAAEGLVREAFAQLDLETARRGGFREVFVESLKHAVAGLSVDLRGGYATLPIAEQQIVALGQPEIVWDQSSPDGIPGNALEAAGATTVAVGDQGLAAPHLALGHERVGALVDGSAASCFEWERCIVYRDQHQAKRDSTTGALAGYEPGFVLDIIRPDTWELVVVERSTAPVRAAALPEEFRGPLRLTLRFRLTEPQVINQLEIVPFRGAENQPAAQLKRVAGNGKPVLDRAFELTRPRSVRMQQVRVETVEVALEQGRSYPTRLAHHYYEEKIENTRRRTYSIFDNPFKAGQISEQHTYEWRRIADPNATLTTVYTNPRAGTGDLFGGLLSDLGTAVGGIAGVIPGGQAIAGIANGLTSAVGAVGKYLFGGIQRQSDRVGVRENWEYFGGERYAIGLAEVTAKRTVYGAEGSTVIGPFVFKSSSRHVSVHLVKQIPDHFPEGDWVALEVSADGATWQAVGEDDVVPFEADAVTVRVTLRRPADLPMDSPLLHEVRVYTS
jgi:hypothetical protein